jgi:hypothetical protein
MVKFISKVFLLICFVISGVAIAQPASKVEAPRGVVQAHDPAMFVATGAFNFNQKSRCATTAKQLPPTKRRKPKVGTKNGRS